MIFNRASGSFTEACAVLQYLEAGNKTFEIWRRGANFPIFEINLSIKGNFKSYNNPVIYDVIALLNI